MGDEVKENFCEKRRREVYVRSPHCPDLHMANPVILVFGF